VLKVRPVKTRVVVKPGQMRSGTLACPAQTLPAGAAFDLDPGRAKSLDSFAGKIDAYVDEHVHYLSEQQHEQIADMLYLCGLSGFTDGSKEGFALFAFGIVDANLDKLVAGQAAVDFLQDRFSQAFLADADNGLEGVGGGT